jgi:hypothetical protein
MTGGAGTSGAGAALVVPGAVVPTSAACTSGAPGAVVPAAAAPAKDDDIGPPSTPITTGESLLDPCVAGEEAKEVNTPDDVPDSLPATTGTASTKEATAELASALRAKRPLRERVSRVGAPGVRAGSGSSAERWRTELPHDG